MYVWPSFFRHHRWSNRGRISCSTTTLNWSSPSTSTQSWTSKYPFHLRTVDFDKKIWSIHKHEGHEDDAHGPTHIHLADDRRLPYAEIDFDTVIDIAARSWRLSPPKPSHENPFWL